MKHSKLVAAAAIVAVGGGIALQTANAGRDPAQLPGVYNVTPLLQDADTFTQALCDSGAIFDESLVSTATLVGCAPAPQ